MQVEIYKAVFFILSLFEWHGSAYAEMLNDISPMSNVTKLHCAYNGGAVWPESSLCKLQGLASFFSGLSKLHGHSELGFPVGTMNEKFQADSLNVGWSGSLPRLRLMCLHQLEGFYSACDRVLPQMPMEFLNLSAAKCMLKDESASSKFITRARASLRQTKHLQILMRSDHCHGMAAGDAVAELPSFPRVLGGGWL